MEKVTGECASRVYNALMHQRIEPGTKEAYQHHLTTPHFQAYKQGTLHMVKSLNLLDIQPLASDAMQQIFIKLQ